MKERKKRKRLTGIVRHVRRPPYVYGHPLKCVIDSGKDLVSIETQCRKCGIKVVLACNKNPEVLAWVDALRRDMEIVVHPQLSSTEKRRALVEFENILRGNTNHE